MLCVAVASLTCAAGAAGFQVHEDHSWQHHLLGWWQPLARLCGSFLLERLAETVINVDTLVEGFHDARRARSSCINERVQRADRLSELSCERLPHSCARGSRHPSRWCHHKRFPWTSANTSCWSFVLSKLFPLMAQQNALKHVSSSLPGSTPSESRGPKSTESSPCALSTQHMLSCMMAIWSVTSLLDSMPCTCGHELA